MRINGPDAPSRPPTHILPENDTTARSALRPSHPNSGLAQQVSRLFGGGGDEGLSSRLSSLAADLEALGVDLRDLSGQQVVRALILRHYSIPLSREMLTEAWHGDYKLYRGLAEVLDTARGLLGDPHLGGSDRASLLALVKGINGLFDKSAPYSAGGGDSGSAESVGRFLETMLAKSGMSFEWRLLSWFRAGQSPESLAALMRDDLKGMLMEFLERMRDRKTTGGSGRKLKQLTKGSSRLMEHITGSQLENLAANRESLRTLYFELPLGSSPGEGQAKIRIDSERHANPDSPDNGQFSVEMDVEMSNIGGIHVFLTLRGDRIEGRFVFPDERFRSMGEKMGQELIERLADRGYAVGKIDMTVRDESASDLGQTDRTPPNNLDVHG